MDALAGRTRLSDRFSALRKVLGPPPDVSIFYGYSTGPAGPTPRPLRLRVDGRAVGWWADYRADAERYRADPVRRALRRDVSAVDWRDFAPGRRFDSRETMLWNQLRDHGVRAAVSAPLHEAGGDGHGALSFICFGPEREFDDWLRGLKPRLIGLAYLFHHGVAADEAPKLTPRERECLALIAGGLSSKQAARRLGVSPRTVDLHVAAAIRRLGAANRMEAVARALSAGLIAFPC